MHFTAIRPSLPSQSLQAYRFIYNKAFYACSKLDNIISLRTSAPTIYSETFNSVPKGGTLKVPEGCVSAYSRWMSTLTNYLGYYEWTCTDTEKDLVLVDGTDMKTLVVATEGVSGMVVIPDGVTSIDKYAFNGNTAITSVTIPASVTTINANAFSGVSTVTEFVLPSTLLSVGANSLSSCKGMKKVTIPNSVQSIGQQAFYGCSALEEMVIGSGVTSIGTQAVQECRKLMKITSLSRTPAAPCSFYGVGNNGTLYVPQGCTSAYSAWMSTGYHYLGFYNWTIQETTY